MKNEKLKLVAIQILEWLNFDTELASVQADADELVEIMVENGLGVE